MQECSGGSLPRQERAPKRYHVMRDYFLRPTDLLQTRRSLHTRGCETLHSDVRWYEQRLMTADTSSRANVLPRRSRYRSPRTGSTDIGKEVPLCTVAAIRERSSAGRGDAYRCGVASPGAAKQQTERRQPSYAAEHTEAAGRGSIRTAVAAAAAGAAGGATGAAPATATYCLLARLARPRAGLAARRQATATR